MIEESLYLGKPVLRYGESQFQLIWRSFLVRSTQNGDLMLDTHNVARKFPLLFVGVTCIGNCEHLTVSSGFTKPNDLFNIFSA